MTLKSNGQLNLATIATYSDLSLTLVCVRTHACNHLKNCRIRRVDSKYNNIMCINRIVVPCSAFLGVFAVSSSVHMYLCA